MHQIAADTGVKDFSQFVFFDDEPRNITDTSALGVRAVLVPELGISVKLVREHCGIATPIAAGAEEQ